MSGIEVLQTVRSWSNVPVILLSIEAEEDHKVHFLRSGADDYVIKPFGIAELAARCEAAIRRYHKSDDKDLVVRTGPLTVDIVSRAVTLDGRYIYPVHVTTRKSFGSMTRKLSVTESQKSAQLRGTFSRRKSSAASANWAQVS